MRIEVFLFMVLLGCTEISAEPPNIALIYRTDQFQKLESGQSDPLLPYRVAITDNGGKVVAFSPSQTANEKAARLESVKGVLLPGGGDMHPSFYHEIPSARLGHVDEALDRLEMEVLKYAQDHGLPILAICLGFQELNVFYGGTLYQDIPSEYPVPETQRVVHRGDNAYHAIQIEPQSKLSTLLSASEITVNTSHHQAIKQLGSGLRIAARSADGIIEAVEGTEHRFLIGVQFHPEKMRAADPRMNGLFTAFLKAASEQNPLN